MDSTELIVVLICVVLLIVGLIYACMKCWRWIGDVADDHMKPKRETRAQAFRNSMRRSFRRAAGGIQRGAGVVRNSFRRARGVPPSAPPPEEPGPPTRPYGSRGGARRYPARPNRQQGVSAEPEQPSQPQPNVPTISGQTSENQSYSRDTNPHPSHGMMPTAKQIGAGTGSQADAPPTYQEALRHETAEQRAVDVRSTEQIHQKSPLGHHGIENAPPVPPGPESYHPSDIEPPPVPPAPYPEQLGFHTGYQQDSPVVTHNVDVHGTPRTPQSGYPYPGYSYTPPDAQSPYAHSNKSMHDHFKSRKLVTQEHHGDQNNQYNSYSPNYSGYPVNQADGVTRTPDLSYSRSRSHENNMTRTQQDNYEQTHRHQGDLDLYSGRKPNESSDYPDRMTSYLGDGNREYNQPPLPKRNYSLNDDDDDGGFKTPSSGRRRGLSSTSRDIGDNRSHGALNRSYNSQYSRDQAHDKPSGADSVDDDYAQIPPRSLRERDPPYSPSSPYEYQNKAFSSSYRVPGDGAYVGQSHDQGHRSQYDGGNLSRTVERGPLPATPYRDDRQWYGDERAQAQYNTQSGIVFPATDRRHMDSDTYI